MRHSSQRGELGAHEGAEFHERHAHLCRVRSVFGQERVGALCLRLGGGRVGWELASVQKPDQHAANVRVEDGDPDSVPEREERAGRVGADAREEGEFLHSKGHLAVVFLDDGARTVFEAQRSRRIAQVCPGHKDVCGGCGGQVGGRGPPLHPIEPDRLDAGHGRLLAHDLEDEGSPIGHVVVSHRQVAFIGCEPAGKVVEEYLRGLGRWICEHPVSVGKVT